MIDKIKEDSLKKELEKLFEGHEQALLFVRMYANYCELIDDMVDEQKSIESVHKVTQYAAVLFNCDYWKKWGHALYLVDRINHHTYFDAVEWEKSDEEWKRRDARVLSHCGYNMLFAVILIEFNEAILDKISLRFRTHAHENHIKDKI